jgi:hypothetical protein
MAKDKKSFVLYADLIHTIEKMPDNSAGKLFKHVLLYVNDKNPTTDDILVELTFEPIKQQLKRDLAKYENKREQWSEAGKRSAEAKKAAKSPDINKEAISTDVNEVQRTLTTVNETQRPLTVVNSVATVSTVNVNDNVNVTVNDNVTVIKNNIDTRKLKFSESLKPYLDVYGKDMLNDFYLYWTEPTNNGNKFRRELQKTWDVARRLKTWSSNNFNKPAQSGNIIQKAVEGHNKAMSIIDKMYGESTDNN